MSDELIEKVARALAKYGRASFPTMERQQQYVDYAWRRFSDEAREAIAACRDELETAAYDRGYDKGFSDARMVYEPDRTT